MAHGSDLLISLVLFKLFDNLFCIESIEWCLCMSIGAKKCYYVALFVRTPPSRFPLSCCWSVSRQERFLRETAQQSQSGRSVSAVVARFWRFVSAQVSLRQNENGFRCIQCKEWCLCQKFMSRFWGTGPGWARLVLPLRGGRRRWLLDDQEVVPIRNSC